MKKTAGEKLRDLRTAFGLSQAQFGERIGITRGSIASYENNINPLAKEAKWKILQATGISDEYFDTDMELWEAFDKFGIDPTHLQLKSLTDTIISFYDSLEAFAGRAISKTQSISAKISVLNFLFHFENTECSLVSIKGSRIEPFAKDGDILAVTKEEYPNNGQWVIAEFNNNLLISKYILSDKNSITLKSVDKNEFKFSIDEFKEKVKILGIIQAISSIKNI
ncbi:MAG: LexA family transcriptional regulator [Campylobacter sp.]|nr:LexA family transcriptional regulator [Campylobacter sp.]